MCSSRSDVASSVNAGYEARSDGGGQTTPTCSWAGPTEPNCLGIPACNVSDSVSSDFDFGHINVNDAWFEICMGLKVALFCACQARMKQAFGHNYTLDQWT